MSDQTKTAWADDACTRLTDVPSFCISGRVTRVVGQVVEIVEGPFSDFSGTVEDVIPDKGKVKVSVSLFGRPTTVELDYLQLRSG